jgi:hypothetical protein
MVSVVLRRLELNAVAGGWQVWVSLVVGSALFHAGFIVGVVG